MGLWSRFALTPEPTGNLASNAVNKQIGASDIETAVEGMLLSGGAFNRKILGALSDGN